jgi:N-formylglutamate amidohydrolase
MNRLTGPAPDADTGAMDDLAADQTAAYRVSGPAPGVAATPVIFASPHSGRIYPAAMMAATRLDPSAIRRSEDAHVDELIAAAPAHGHALIAARFARAYLDVNREPWELDASMFEDDLPPFARARTARVAAGLGAIARVVGEGQEIYTRKLTFAEAEARVRDVHQPYHAALSGLIGQARARFGLAVLVDCHSMPSAAAVDAAGQGCDMVLGDRFGAACAGSITRLVEGELELRGYRVARNAPYAGGYTTEHYGRPARGVHALQIEINRALYFDEARSCLTGGFERLKADMEQLCQVLASVDWTTI